MPDKVLGKREANQHIRGDADEEDQCARHGGCRGKPPAHRPVLLRNYPQEQSDSKHFRLQILSIGTQASPRERTRFLHFESPHTHLQPPLRLLPGVRPRTLPLPAQQVLLQILLPLVVQPAPHLPHRAGGASGPLHRGEEEAVEPAEALYRQPLHQLPEGKHKGAIRWTNGGSSQEHRAKQEFLLFAALQ